MIEFIRNSLEKFNMPEISWSDILEILLVWFLVYKILDWMKRTKAFALLKGIGVLAVILVIAELTQMNTILWISEKFFTIAATAAVVIFQKELRDALEVLGRKNYFKEWLPFETAKADEGRFSDRTIDEVIKACSEMAKVKTGALIIIEQNSSLAEIEKTGIAIDSLVSSQLLINIFEHNTPLHDGAVVMRGDRITAATCYLPLSESLSLSKELGTRHRAGVGISEATDALAIIVSEETGRISIAYKGNLTRNVDEDTFRDKLELIQNKPDSEKKHTHFKVKGGKHEN